VFKVGTQRDMIHLAVVIYTGYLNRSQFTEIALSIMFALAYQAIYFLAGQNYPSIHLFFTSFSLFFLLNFYALQKSEI